MTTMQSIGAPSAQLDFDSLNWQQIEKRVKRLQIRIAKATRDVSSIAGLFIGPLFRLEPCEGKLSCTVLRRADGSNVIRLSDQDHRFIKRITRPMLGFKNFWCAR